MDVFAQQKAPSGKTTILEIPANKYQAAKKPVCIPFSIIAYQSDTSH